MAIRREYNRLVRKAFLKAIEVIGDRGKTALIFDLELNGVYLNDQSLTLGKLTQALKSILGEDATDVIMQRVLIKLDEICDSQPHDPVI